ncbi:MAG: hypothetical protein P1U59_10150 [Alcanivorax sp.]|uniref:hypothetical protein n=1 Tax=Alcanivorax sp. TaxID=1872427 RepID=UPI0019BACB62|nr:hypothetical protein [Alcanivorax sp.]MBD3645010.1 hypothetical protein [Alcanivorax sp.]MDF1724877.1 hypothetical protein [Alcanivorax sp.]
MKALLAALLLTAMVLVMVRWLPTAAQTDVPALAENNEVAAKTPALKQQKQAAATLPMIDTVAERERQPVDSRLHDSASIPAPSPQAIAALRESMRHGDARTPPLAPGTDLREPPGDAELADPALYQQYEQRQQQQVYASFAQAADQRIPELEALIAKGRAEGISEAQLAEGEAKLAKLREQRDQLAAQQPSVDEASAEEEQD